MPANSSFRRSLSRKRTFRFRPQARISRRTPKIDVRSGHGVLTGANKWRPPKPRFLTQADVTQTSRRCEARLSQLAASARRAGPPGTMPLSFGDTTVMLIRPHREARMSPQVETLSTRPQVQQRMWSIPGPARRLLSSTRCSMHARRSLPPPEANGVSTSSCP